MSAFSQLGEYILHGVSFTFGLETILSNHPFPVCQLPATGRAESGGEGRERRRRQAAVEAYPQCWLFGTIPAGTHVREGSVRHALKPVVGESGGLGLVSVS